MFGFSTNSRSIKDMTIEDFSLGMGVFSLWIAFLMYDSYSIKMDNAEGVAKMQSAVPYVATMEGIKLPDKMEYYSNRHRGRYSGGCNIIELQKIDETIRYYKQEFERNGWHYLGNYRPTEYSGGLYCFEADGEYHIDLSFGTWYDYKYKSVITDVSCSIRMKSDISTEHREKCRIEDE